MDNTQTLELQIKSTADGAVQSVKLLNSSLTKTKSTVDNVSKSISSMGKAFSMGGLYLGVKKLSTTFLKWMDLAVDRTEQLNLFNVVFKNMEKNGVKTFSTLGKQATQFQNKMNEAFGTNLTETTKYQGLFQSMGENVGIPDTYSALMSTTMTKLTYDLASLYNKQESTVAEALRAGVYAGQTKPLRSYGIDVTQTSMQPILDSLGITDRSVKQMSQAEKEILRYLATLRQAKTAMGDFANTIESPANQLKIFKQQLTEAKVALSSLFIGTFSKILPYANALLMVIKEVAKAIGTMFGIELSDYNTGIADSSDAFVDLGDSIDDATDSVKELKRQTLGFDQINNINENKDSGSGGGSVSGGIDQRLLDAIYGYDNGMDKVRMKATEIRDRIMEWLGFTKQIDPLTREISWKLDGSNSTMGKIISALRDIVKYGKEAVVGVFREIKKDFDNGTFGKFLTGIFESIADLFKFIASHKEVQKIIAKTIETLLLIKTVKTVLKPVTTLWKTFVSKIETGAKFVQTFGKQLKGTNNYILDSKGNLKQYNKQIEGHNNVVLNSDKSVNKWKTTLNGAKTALMGIGTAVAGLYMVHDAMEDIVNEGPNVTNVLEGIIGSLSTIGGFATIGSIFGPIGTAIGVVTGVIATLADTIFSFSKETEEANRQTYLLENKLSALKIASNKGTGTLEEYTTTFNNLVDSVVDGLPNITNYTDKIKENETKFIDAKTAVQNFFSEMQASGKSFDSTSFETINTHINTIVESIKGTGTAQINATQVILDNLLEEQRITEETAKTVIESAKLRAQSNNDNAEAYRQSMLLLESDLKKGKITTEEFNKKQKELAKEFGITTDAIEEGKKKLEEFVTYINGNTLNYEDFDSLKDTIDGIGTSYKNATDTIKTNYGDQATILKENLHYWKNLRDEQQKTVDNLIKTKGIESNEYKNAKAVLDDYKTKYESISSSISALNSARKDDIVSVKETTAIALLGMLNSLKETGYDMNEDSEGIVEKINKEFKRIGIEEEINMNDTMNGIINTINKSLGTNIPSVVTSTNKELKKIGELIDLYENGKKTGKTYKSGFESIKPTIKLYCDGSEVDSYLSNFTSRYPISGKASGGAFYSGSWHNIQQYANGGSPSHGSVFVAGEAGSELVGHINGRTEVLNQSQLASVMYNAVLSAMSKVGGQSIDVHVHSDEGVIIDRINQTTKQTGVCPINIPIN